MSSCVSTKPDVTPIAAADVAQEPRPKVAVPTVPAALLKAPPKRRPVPKGATIGDALMIGADNGRRLDRAGVQVTALQEVVKAQAGAIRQLVQ